MSNQLLPSSEESIINLIALFYRQFELSIEMLAHNFFGGKIVTHSIIPQVQAGTTENEAFVPLQNRRSSVFISSLVNFIQNGVICGSLFIRKYC